MPGFTWTFDAASGVFKQHALSKKLYEKAVEEAVFMPYVRPVSGFGKNKGENVTLMRISDITEPSDGSLQENSRIPEDNFAMSTVAITVTEYGRAVPITSLAQDLSEFDVTSAVQRRLVTQQKLTLDTAVATAFKTCKVKYTPTGVASATVSTTGTAGATATANLNVFHVEEITDSLYDDYACPPWAGEDYMAIVRTLGIRGILRDPAWEQWQVYTTPEKKGAEEVGRISRCRFLRTNHVNALAEKASGVLGEGIFFGEDAVAMAEVQTPELRVAMAQDYGRSQGVAWYGILGFGLIWDTANKGEARVIHLTSL